MMPSVFRRRVRSCSSSWNSVANFFPLVIFDSISVSIGFHRGGTISTKYALGPYIGIARLGNSQDSFYLAPDGIGALPIECDQNGNPVVQGGTFERVRRFKDDAGGIRRQGAWFRIFQIEDGKAGGTEITLDNPEVESITWTVHLASKKAAWYNF